MSVVCKHLHQGKTFWEGKIQQLTKVLSILPTSYHSLRGAHLSRMLLMKQ